MVSWLQQDIFLSFMFASRPSFKISEFPEVAAEFFHSEGRADRHE